MRANSNLYQSVGGFYFKFKFFDIFRNFDYNVKELNDFKPTIIIGQPSILKLLAEYSIKNDKKYPLIETMTIAETLEKNVEDFITNTFKVPNYNIYQATEGFIACTYGDHLIHINEDLVYIEKEYIDKEIFNYFLRSGIFKEYIEKYLKLEQIDVNDIEEYIIRL